VFLVVGTRRCVTTRGCPTFRSLKGGIPQSPPTQDFAAPLNKLVIPPPGNRLQSPQFTGSDQAIIDSGAPPSADPTCPQTGAFYPSVLRHALIRRSSVPVQPLITELIPLDCSHRIARSFPLAGGKRRGQGVPARTQLPRGPTGLLLRFCAHSLINLSLRHSLKSPAPSNLPIPSNSPAPLTVVIPTPSAARAEESAVRPCSPTYSVIPSHRPAFSGLKEQ
jgi:hypothetical protein